jgi:periplasmic divalent cation tolerance protein
MTALVCFCTCPDRDTAQGIADALVGERLAACVNVLPGLRSVYRWHGAIERADEVMLIIKTVRERLDQVTARVAALHPNELPEVIAVEIAGGLAAYLDWVAECSGDADATDKTGEPGTAGHGLRTGD